MSFFQNKCIVLDLTPLVPGGANGGLGLLAQNLAAAFARLAPACRFVWLTANDTHDELSALALRNVELRCVYARASTASTAAPFTLRAKRAAREKLKALIPATQLAKLKSLYRQRVRPEAAPAQWRALPLLAQLNADLLFCPFTAPLYANAAVPTVSIVVDLQYLHYPQFFSADDYYYRDKHFNAACRLADHLVCISDFVRGTVLAQSGLPHAQVSMIHIGLSHHVKTVSAESATQCLAQYQLESNQYFLYPANFWQHKNHELLLTAWGMWNAQHPQSALKLVLTGSPDARQTTIRAAARRIGLDNKLIFPGYLNDESFSTLLQNCRAVLFPSLYEGFGMPIVEAMATGKPVLCSNVTSLPEVGGDAVLTFDPRKPAEIVNAIDRLENEAGLASQLIERGYKQAARFGNSESMAQQYLKLFQDVIASRQAITGL